MCSEAGIRTLDYPSGLSERTRRGEIGRATNWLRRKSPHSTRSLLHPNCQRPVAERAAGTSRRILGDANGAGAFGPGKGKNS